MRRLKGIVNSRFFVWMILALPAAYWVFADLSERLYYGELMHATGELSGRLLLVTLAVTPLRLLFPDARWPLWLLQRRRYLGVATFAYALLHTLIYLEKVGDPSTILAEAMAFEYWTGWLGLLMFLPLVATSNNRSVRVLKSAWKKLHRWVYAAALLSFLHWIFVAFDFLPGLMHGLLLVALLGVRIWRYRGT